MLRSPVCGFEALVSHVRKRVQDLERRRHSPTQGAVVQARVPSALLPERFPWRPLVKLSLGATTILEGSIKRQASNEFVKSSVQVAIAKLVRSVCSEAFHPLFVAVLDCCSALRCRRLLLVGADPQQAADIQVDHEHVVVCPRSSPYPVPSPEWSSTANSSTEVAAVSVTKTWSMYERDAPFAARCYSSCSGSPPHLRAGP